MVWKKKNELIIKKKKNKNITVFFKILLFKINFREIYFVKKLFSRKQNFVFNNFYYIKIIFLNKIILFYVMQLLVTVNNPIPLWHLIYLTRVSQKQLPS